MLRAIIVSIRPAQWYKNSLLFVGIVFSANLLNTAMWATVVLAFIYWCLLSAGEYLINDILDKERDKKHPTKSRRPIASGQLKVSHAFLLALLLIAASLAGAYLTINLRFFIISLLYMALICAYSCIFKHLIIADVLVISAGFVIRAVAGCLAIDVYISPWLIVCTFLLAQFLAMEKRRYELVTLADNAKAHRPNLSEYSTEMLDQLIIITIAVLLASYLLYTFFTGNDAMLLTSPFAIYGLFRYHYLSSQKGIEAEPLAVFKDKAMLLNLVIWGLLVLSIIMYKILA